MKGLVGTKIDLAVCGEMGGRRLEALALLGIGFRRLSITPAAVGPIKELVRKVDLGELSAAMREWCCTRRRACEPRWANGRRRAGSTPNRRLCCEFRFATNEPQGRTSALRLADKSAAQGKLHPPTGCSERQERGFRAPGRACGRQKPRRSSRRRPI